MKHLFALSAMLLSPVAAYQLIIIADNIAPMHSSLKIAMLIMLSIDITFISLSITYKKSNSSR